MRGKFIQPLLKAILAGICISIGGAVYVSSPNNVVGSIFFGFALFFILNYDYNLYTGKVGYLFDNKPSYLFYLLIVILGNLIGTIFSGLLLNQTSLVDLFSKANQMAELKLQNDILSVFILSIFCGILMYVGVDFFRNKENPLLKTLMIFLVVPIFILSKFEHSVANMFYFTIGKAWSLKTIFYLIIMIIGNAVGAIIFNSLNKTANKN